MARLPRVVVPNHPHHVTQRGNRRLREGVMGVPGIARNYGNCGIAAGIAGPEKFLRWLESRGVSLLQRNN